MTLEEIIKSWYAVYLCDYGLTDKTIDILKKNIRNQLPKKEKENNLGYEYLYVNGYNQALKDIRKKLK